MLGISPLVAIAGTVGLVLAISLYGFGLGAWLPKGSIGSAEAEARARNYAAAQSIDVTGSGAIVHPAWIESVHLEPLVERVGLERLRQAARSDELAVPVWQVDFRRQLMTSDLDEDPGGFSVTLAGNGTVVGASFHTRDGKGEKFERNDARARVESQLRDAGVDVTGFTERGEAAPNVQINFGNNEVPVVVMDDDAHGDSAGIRSRRRGEPAEQDGTQGDGPRESEGAENTAKSEHKFVFEQTDARFPNVRRSIEARVNSVGIVEFESRTRPEGISTIGTRGVVSQVIEGIAVGGASVLLVVILIGAFAFRLITRDFVSIWRACLVGLLFVATMVASTIVGSHWSNSGIAVYALQFLVGLPVGFILVAAWTAGEADAYFAWGKSSTEGALAALTGRLHSRQVAREAIEGTFWGWILLGVLACTGAIVASWLGPEFVIERPAFFAADARPSALFAITMLPAVFVHAVVFLLFLPAWLHRLTRRTWIAVPIAATVAAPFAAAFELADLRFDLLPGSVSWGLLVSAICILLVVRRGFLTASFALFTFSVFFYAVGAIVSASTGDRLAAGFGIAVFLAPAIASVIAGSRLPEANVREAPPPRVSAVMDQARRHEELDIARRVQAGLLPSRDPSVQGFDIAGTCLPANEVGGDYYDYFPFEDGKFGLAVGDVSGKGVPAAFCMTLTKGFMEVASDASRNPGDVLSAANGHLREYLSRGTFVTMAYAVLDPEAMTVQYARAGHNPPAVIRADGEASFAAPSGTALGAADEARFAELIASERLELRRGDALVFYTDGVTEAMSNTGEQFGEDRLLASLVRLHDGRPARAVADGLLEAVAEHSRDASQHDDITVVVVCAEDVASV